MTSFALGGPRTDSATFNTVAATAAAILGFPILFYAFGLVVLGISATLMAALGPASSGTASAPLASAAGSLAIDLGVAAANFVVAITVLSLAARLFHGARHRLTLLNFAAAYAILAGSVTLTTEINLGWSVTGVLAACVLRFIQLSASGSR